MNVEICMLMEDQGIPRKMPSKWSKEGSSRNYWSSSTIGVNGKFFEAITMAEYDCFDSIWLCTIHTIQKLFFYSQLKINGAKPLSGDYKVVCVSSGFFFKIHTIIKAEMASCHIIY